MSDAFLIPNDAASAALQLARCKVAAAEVGGFHKTADFDWQQALTPVAIGAGVGGLGGLALGARSKRKVNPLWTALNGAALGAAGGGAYSALRHSGVLSSPPELQPGEIDKRLDAVKHNKLRALGGPALEAVGAVPGVGTVVRGVVDTVYPGDVKPTPGIAPNESLGGQALRLGREYGDIVGPTALVGVPSSIKMQQMHADNEAVNALVTATTGETTNKPIPGAPKPPKPPKGSTGTNPRVHEIPVSTKYTATAANGGRTYELPAWMDSNIQDIRNAGTPPREMLTMDRFEFVRKAKQRALFQQLEELAKPDGVAGGAHSKLHELIAANKRPTTPLSRGIRATGRNAMAFGIPGLISYYVRKARGLD